MSKITFIAIMYCLCYTIAALFKLSSLHPAPVFTQMSDSKYRESESFLNELVSSRQSSPCDTRDDQIKRTILKDLSKKQFQPSTEIEKPKALPIEFEDGSLYLQVAQKQNEIVRNEHSSWKKLFEDYLKGKDTNDHGFWLNMNAEFDSLMLEDEIRKADRIMSIDMFDLPNLKTGKRKMYLCLRALPCLWTDFSKNEVLDLGSFFNGKKIEFKQSKKRSAYDQKKNLFYLYEKLAGELDRYDDKFYKSMTAYQDSSGKHFDIPMDISKLHAPAQRLLKTKIESIWRSKDYRVNIVGPVPYANPFQVVFDSKTSGGRFYVSRVERTMHIFNHAYFRSVAHEFGHIIGFADHYYTVWSGRTCSYSYQSRSGDIMSESMDGSVTSDEWNDLWNFAHDNALIVAKPEAH